MSRKRIIILVGAALLVLLVAGFATAHGTGGSSWWGGHQMMGNSGQGHGQMMGNSGWGHGQMMGETNGNYAPCGRQGGNNAAIPAEKSEAAQKLYQEYQEKTQGLQEQLYAKQTQLQGVLADPKAGSRQAKGLVKDINSLRSDLFTEQVAFKQAFAKETGVSFHQGKGRRGGGGRGW